MSSIYTICLSSKNTATQSDCTKHTALHNPFSGYYLHTQKSVLHLPEGSVIIIFIAHCLNSGTTYQQRWQILITCGELLRPVVCCDNTRRLRQALERQDWLRQTTIVLKYMLEEAYVLPQFIMSCIFLCMHSLANRNPRTTKDGASPQASCPMAGKRSVGADHGRLILLYT